MARLKRGNWFLPETPDVAGLLGRQLEVTLDGLEAMCRWAAGDAAAALGDRQGFRAPTATISGVVPAGLWGLGIRSGRRSPAGAVVPKTGLEPARPGGH